MRPIPVAIVLTLAVVAGVAGYFSRGYFASSSATATVPAEGAGAPLPTATLTDLDGGTHHFQDWRGKLLLINFWATWCTPCLKEIPLLVKAQAEYGARGLQIVAPALDDPDEVRRAAKGPLAIPYPVMVDGSPDVMINLLNAFGNTAGALPFTVVVDAGGQVVHQQLGEFSADELKALIEKHLPH